MGTIKEKLTNLYLGKWENLKEELKKHIGYEEFQCPHLLSTTDEFEDEWNQADIRLMIFGIKTNGWRGEEDMFSISNNRKAINNLMKLYEDFYFREGNWDYGQPFWNYFYSIHELLKFRLNKKISVIWNNVYKLEDAPAEIESQHFNVTLDEVSIFCPNVIIQMGFQNNVHNIFLSKLSDSRQSSISIDDYADWDKDKALYSINTYDLEEKQYSEIKKYVKKMIITYHPNAHGKAGIKMKYLIEKLVEDLNVLE
jgi:hypothetical protein